MIWLRVIALSHWPYYCRKTNPIFRYYQCLRKMLHSLETKSSSTLWSYSSDNGTKIVNPANGWWSSIGRPSVVALVGACGPQCLLSPNVYCHGCLFFIVFPTRANGSHIVPQTLKFYCHHLSHGWVLCLNFAMTERTSDKSSIRRSD